jgi:hypothetical protein
MSEDKDLIWVPKKYADAYKKAKSDDEQLVILEHILSKQKRDIKQDLIELEHDEAQFRASILRYKKAFTEIYENNAKQVNKLWEDIEKKKPNQKNFLKRLENDLAPILGQIEHLSKVIENVNTYHLVRFVELIDKIQSCGSKTQNLLLKVIEFSLTESKAKS